MLRLSPAANTRRCQLPSATGNQAEYVRNQRQACAAQMVATGVRHAPAAAGATVRYRSLLVQWSQNQRPSQSTIQTKSSAAPQHLPPPVQPQPLQQLGLFRQHHVMGTQLGLHGAAHVVRVDTTYPPPHISRPLPEQCCQLKTSLQQALAVNTGHPATRAAQSACQ
jgi:hypothetical protein